MSDEHLLAEARRTLARLRQAMTSAGDAAQVAPSCGVFGVEDEWDEGGAAGDDVEAELFGERVAEGGGAHLRDGEAAGGDDYGVG